MKLKKTYILFANIIVVLVLLFSKNIEAQIYLTNPSFEDEPADATLPTGWWKVSPNTTPDILPGYWGIYEDASEGDTYLGLITRENNTFESMGQKLPERLIKDVCYSMSIDIAHGENYAGYSNPAKVRIYISTKKKDRQQLIFESEASESTEWETINFDFNPTKNMRYIIIEAYHEKLNQGYKSNILIDNISSILQCDKA